MTELGRQYEFKITSINCGENWPRQANKLDLVFSTMFRYEDEIG